MDHQPTPAARKARTPIIHFDPRLTVRDINNAAQAIGCRLVAKPDGTVLVTPRVK